RIEGIGPTAVDLVTGTPGVEFAAPVEVQPLSLGGESGSIVAASPDAVAAIVTTASGTFDPVAVSEAIRVDVPAPVFPEGTAHVELAVALENFAVPPAIGIWVVDGFGSLRLIPLDLQADPDSAGARYAADIPDDLATAPHPWRVLSMDIRIPDEAVVGHLFGRLTLTALTAITAEVATDVPLDQYWLPDSPELQFSPPSSDGTGHGFLVYSDTVGVRLTPSFDTTFDDRIRPPVIVSQQLAETFDVAVGDQLSFPLQEGFDRLNAVVAGIVPAIPGAPTDTALLMDLAVVQHFQLRIAEEPARPRDVWVATDQPQAVAHEIRELFPANAQIDSARDPAGRQVLGSAAIALWAGAAVCGVLALIGVAAAARAQLRSRRGEVAVLRAIGLGAGDQAGIRARELGIVLGTGLLAGLLAGATVSLLTVPQLARAAIPVPYPAIGTELSVDLAGLGAALLALVVALTIVVAISVAGVAALARRALPAEGVS
ncbi:MAG: FtsX-like permease family protein, partial [Pseudolysinimonas sp.]